MRDFETGSGIFSYTKNPCLQLKKRLILDDFHEPWIPKIISDIERREKKPQWEITPVYNGIVHPWSYFFIGMDSGRYLVPLPKINKNSSIKRYTITKVQYQLGKVLTGGGNYNTSYDDLLKECKIEVLD